MEALLGNCREGYSVEDRPYGLSSRRWATTIIESGDEIGLRLHIPFENNPSQLDRVLSHNHITMAMALLNGQAHMPSTTDHLVVFSLDDDPGVIKMCPIQSFMQTYFKE